MSPAPSPTTPWVPLWSFQDPNVIPTPVNGKWLKGGPGGAMVWSDIPGLQTPDSGWLVLGTDVGYINGWANYADPYGPVRFRKLPSGLVVFNGLMQGGSVAAAFIIPAGWRPAPQAGGSIRHHIFNCAMGGGVGSEACRVFSDGTLQVTSSYAPSWIDLSGVAYWAGA